MNQSLINRTSLEDFTEDDPELLGDLYVLFVRALPDALAKLNFAIENSDPNSLRENAHRLKSQLSYFFCEPLVNRAQELEDLGRQGNTRDAKTVFTDLRPEIGNLLVELNQLTGLNLCIEED